MQKANQRNTIHKVNQIWTSGYDKDRYATCKETKLCQDSSNVRNPHAQTYKVPSVNRTGSPYKM